jgi:hypothetical protein
MYGRRAGATAAPPDRRDRAVGGPVFEETRATSRFQPIPTPIKKDQPGEGLCVTSLRYLSSSLCCCESGWARQSGDNLTTPGGSEPSSRQREVRNKFSSTRSFKQHPAGGDVLTFCVSCLSLCFQESGDGRTLELCWPVKSGTTSLGFSMAS